MASLAEVAAKVAADGPYQLEPTNRRVRGLLGGKWVFDTLEAQYVWEHKYYPYFYLPIAALEAGPGELVKDKEEEGKGFSLARLRVGDKSADVAIFSTGKLNGLVKIKNDALDAWYAEDEKVLGPHPKNPYTRIECLPSSREVRIEVDGTVVARSTNSVFLLETGLRTRYYLSPTSVLDWSTLVPSDTKTFCPYKGEANYYHLKIGDKEVKDAVWYYTYPLPESAQVQGLLAFYNEKLDVFIDGVKEKK